MEIHPYVLAMMKQHATSEAELRRWTEYHERVTAREVAEQLDAIERDDYLDAVGWDA